MFWYHYLIMVMFLAMVVSPVWFFNKIEHLLSDEDEMTVHSVGYLNPTTTMLPEDTEDDIVHEEHVVANLSRMVQNAPNDTVRQLWFLKQKEYERQLRWQHNLRRSHNV